MWDMGGLSRTEALRQRGQPSNVRNYFAKAWYALRNGFSSSVLGTTSRAVPDLDGGLSSPVRLSIVTVAVASALLAGWAAGRPDGELFFFPALTVAGLFGGAILALAAYAVCLALAAPMFDDGAFWILAAAAAAQTGVALLLRGLFRESRRWGVRYRHLLAMTSSAVTVSDAQGRIERPHPELERLIGMPWPDYAGTNWLASVHPEDRNKIVPQRPFESVAVQSAELRLRNPVTGDWRWHLMRAVPLKDASGKVVEWISTLNDVHERKLSGEQQDMVIGEARHRLKNLMTIIDSLVKMSRPRGAGATVEAFEKKLLGRLHALSAAGDLALASNYTTMMAHEVVAATLAPFLETESARLTFGGPDLRLREATGGALAMGIHELTTNAIKHGALSVPEGRVSFTWTVVKSDQGSQVEMLWRETGGPPPQPPEREGYGARVIAFIPSREHNGMVKVEYPPDGYLCRIRFTLLEAAKVPELAD